MEYSDKKLLQYALTMLDLAREEQAKSNRKNKWLTNNSTVETIRARVAEIKGDQKDPNIVYGSLTGLPMAYKE